MFRQLRARVLVPLTRRFLKSKPTMVIVLVAALIGATMVAGVVLGFAFARLAGGALSQLTLTADNDNAFVIASIAAPLIGHSRYR